MKGAMTLSDHCRLFGYPTYTINSVPEILDLHHKLGTQDTQHAPKDGQCAGWHGHDMCPYSTARHEQISVGHAAQHDMRVDWVGPRILGMWALKARHDRDRLKHGTRKDT